MMMENSTILLPQQGCNYCSGGMDLFYHEPPPDDIMFIPSPPMHPSFQSSLSEYLNQDKNSYSKQQIASVGDQCNFCGIFSNDGSQSLSGDENVNNRIVFLLISFLMISGLTFIYLISTKRNKIIASLTQTRLFKANHQGMPPNHHHLGHPLDKSGSLNESIANSNVHITDPCFLQTNRDKNLTSPIINDHKKTSIPSKYWAQPGSIIGRTIRRIPNEYEVPSSRTNSTGTSSAVYADMNNVEGNNRFFSPYNLHTYAEVREVLDPNEHFHTSSNSSVMLSESNYDNAVYSHGNGCVMGNGTMMTNGSVQMSDFNNSMRPMQSMAYGPPNSMNHQQQHLSTQSKMHLNNGQPMYEQPPQRAQIIITSNNQGVNPTLLNYKERIHNVI